MPKTVRFRCIKVSQPIGEFYIGSIDSKDLLRIAYADWRRISERDVEAYLGIQRPLSPSRVNELYAYVNTVDATFPTSIILHVNSTDANYLEKRGVMEIADHSKAAKIIDGQHRIAGLEQLRDGKFEINVTIFVDMDIEDQAMVFATINLKQTKVNKSLAYDLYEFAKSRSPQKTCHNIAKLLNSEEDSPFKGKIKILGVASGGKDESLTQATFVERPIPYITTNPIEDRDVLKRGRKLKKLVSQNEMNKRIFYELFRSENDGKIARILWNYFTVVGKRWPLGWYDTKVGNILNRTTGFSALMRFLRDAYLFLGEEVPTKEMFMDVFIKIALQDEDFNPKKYIPGSGGEKDLYTDLVEMSGV